MAAVSTIVAAATAAVTAATAYQQQRVQKKAASDAKEEERKAKRTAAAEQSAQQAEKTRAQIREERVRRAQIMQSSENTGVTASSGAIGSSGALSTQTGANLASMTRQANSANAITTFNQNAAYALAEGQAKSDMWGNIGQVTTSGLDLFGQYKAQQEALQLTQQQPTSYGTKGRK